MGISAEYRPCSAILIQALRPCMRWRISSRDPGGGSCGNVTSRARTVCRRPGREGACGTRRAPGRGSRTPARESKAENKTARTAGEGTGAAHPEAGRPHCGRAGLGQFPYCPLPLMASRTYFALRARPRARQRRVGREGWGFKGEGKHWRGAEPRGGLKQRPSPLLCVRAPSYLDTIGITGGFHHHP